MVALPSAPVEVQHVGEREITAYITVENEERLRISSLYLITKVVNPACSSKGSELLIIPKKWYFLVI